MSGERQRLRELAGGANARGTGFGKAAADYARYRAGFPARLYDELVRRGVRWRDADVVDLGCGTGTLARGFAARGARVTGVDISGALLAQAERLARAAGLSLSCVLARAEQTGLPAAAFDLVSAGQCWHWFDRRRAAREVTRLLRPGGTALLAHFDYLTVDGGVVEATDALIERICGAPQASGYRLCRDGIYPQWFADLAGAGLVLLESGSFDEDVGYSEQAWRGRMRAQGHVSACDAETSARFDGALAQRIARAGAGADLPRLADGRLRVPHRCFFIIARKRGR